MTKKSAKKWLQIGLIWGVLMLIVGNVDTLTNMVESGIGFWLYTLVTLMVFVQLCRAIYRYMKKAFKKAKYYYGLYVFFTVGSGSVLIKVIADLVNK